MSLLCDKEFGRRLIKKELCKIFKTDAHSYSRMHLDCIPELDTPYEELTEKDHLGSLQIYHCKYLKTYENVLAKKAAKKQKRKNPEKRKLSVCLQETLVAQEVATQLAISTEKHTEEQKLKDYLRQKELLPLIEKQKSIKRDAEINILKRYGYEKNTCYKKIAATFPLEVYPYELIKLLVGDGTEVFGTYKWRVFVRGILSVHEQLGVFRAGDLVYKKVFPSVAAILNTVSVCHGFGEKVVARSKNPDGDYQTHKITEDFIKHNLGGGDCTQGYSFWFCEEGVSLEGVIKLTYRCIGSYE